MILVVGATGLVGMEVVRRLGAAGKSVRALVRRGSDPAKVDALRRAPATLWEGDLKDPATVRPACGGVDTVISTASATLSAGAGDSIATVDRDGQLNLVSAAREAGVRHFIFVSFSGNLDDPFPLRDAKRAVEHRLQQSGLAYTIVRPSCFMEVWLGAHVGFDPAAGTVRIFGSGDQGISFISFADVAAYVAGCVDNPGVLNHTIELGGPEPVSYHRAIELYERALGRTMTREYVPVADLQQQYAAATDPIAKTFAALMLGAARGDAIDVRPALEKVPIALTPIESFVRRNADVLRHLAR
jgi:uncharacterized protein YbjT (DUF2867 family)